MVVKLIVAVAKGNNGIGKNNQLLWHLPADMKYFKETTRGFPIITGRKNYESIPEKFRPLPGRENVVITRDVHYKAPGAHVCTSINEAIELTKKFEKESCFIIGGGQIYKQCLDQNLVDELYITWVDTSIAADTFFEGFLPKSWHEEELIRQVKDVKNQHGFTVVKYTKL
ncbi:MAG: dihydrofolate reductase [Saprospiraceae bacterium]|jgi:dihydrofolate reductase